MQTVQSIVTPDHGTSDKIQAFFDYTAVKNGLILQPMTNDLSKFHTFFIAHHTFYSQFVNLKQLHPENLHVFFFI